MKIVGLETIIFGVEDVASCATFLTDYGLFPVDVTETGGRFEALDGTAVVLAHVSDESIPASIGNGCMMRKTVMGVADQETIDAIRAELSKDRKVRTLADGSIESTDDSGFVIGFQVTTRKELNLAGEISNVPGSPFQRPVNHRAVQLDAGPIRPRTLSHIVYFVPDPVKAEAFYVERLGFRCTDRFEGAGPFLQPAGTLDHHTHFLIGAPAFMQGVEHFTFHFAGPTEVMQNGSQFIEKGYQAFWGPGRHIMGSNWFWYFNSPFACHIEMDADMDLHDKNWSPRAFPMGADNSQAFLLRYRNKWSPGKDTPQNGDYE
ncbi:MULTISPECIES: VOC family protein [Marinomonas]|uniref:VOC family protein n=1 Tax=Marinomonas rhodophyticola TaxID=2992803 RepID=A0ABT3KB14_9GAMM|nr:VOC family protein [Marinomonas sp. KJ51-3]MCW4627725.1 VOC family protein [Marinomonas sp. KJ51-3]